MQWLPMQTWMMLWAHLSESFRRHQRSCAKGEQGRSKGTAAEMTLQGGLAQLSALKGPA